MHRLVGYGDEIQKPTHIICLWSCHALSKEIEQKKQEIFDIIIK